MERFKEAISVFSFRMLQLIFLKARSAASSLLSIFLSCSSFSLFSFSASSLQLFILFSKSLNTFFPHSFSICSKLSEISPIFSQVAFLALLQISLSAKTNPKNGSDDAIKEQSTRKTIKYLDNWIKVSDLIFPIFFPPPP